QMRETRPMKIHNGVISTTTDVWSMLTAAKNGDLQRMKELAAGCPELLTCQYDYTSPMQFAVREGHLEIVKYLVENGALDANEKNHPFQEPLVTLAEDRDFTGIAEFLKKSVGDPALLHNLKDTGKIDHGYDDEQVIFQRAVDRGEHAKVEKMLK